MRGEGGSTDKAAGIAWSRRFRWAGYRSSHELPEAPPNPGEYDPRFDDRMAKEKITVTLDAGVLADVTADAERAGLTRSEMVETALRNEHLRRQLHAYTTHTVSALDRRLRRPRTHRQPSRGPVITPGDILTRQAHPTRCRRHQMAAGSAVGVRRRPCENPTRLCARPPSGQR